MGILVLESGMNSTRTEETFDENVFKDKKKKRRSRKSKQPISASSYESEGCVDLSHMQRDSTSSNPAMSNGHYQLPKEYHTSLPCVASNGHDHVPQENNTGYSSTPSNVNERTSDELQKLLSHEYKEPAAVSGETIGPVLIAQPVEPVLIARPVECQARRKFFPPYLPSDVVTEALENGKLLKGLFRVNAYNKLEAYCKIDGVPTDVLISGVESQNRAIEGDTVAIIIDPPSLWPKMKGSNETLSGSVSHSNSPEAVLQIPDCSTLGNKSHLESEYVVSGGDEIVLKDVVNHANGTSYGTMPDNGWDSEVVDNGYGHSNQQPFSDATGQCFGDTYDSMNLSEKLCALTSLYPSKRPTGRVVAIIEMSHRRDSVVGFLCVKQWINSREMRRKNSRKNKHNSDLNNGYILLSPTDPKFTKMMVPVRNLPEIIKKRLGAGDMTIESDLVAAQVIDWAEESHMPDASVIQILGRGSDVEAQLAAILFENEIDASGFSAEVISCIPQIPWEIPQKEFQCRRDLRKSCIFTIDPASAADLDDALSVEMMTNGVFRVGVHIADVSYFVLPDSALDLDAQIRSTSVYLLQQKLSMLPSRLSNDLASLNPGVDRLAFSIFWDINSAGEVLDRWVSHTVINSCCKLSYEHAQEIIDGQNFQDSNQMVNEWPKLYGQVEWSDVIKSVKTLYKISKVLRENRFKDGALSLETPKIVFLFDEEGMPYDCVLSGRSDSNFLVEEFMLLANRAAAEVIKRAYPSRALLRRHSEPNARKLREFEAFCRKHGLKLDASSSAKFHRSLELIKGELGHDSVFFDILMSYAARPMQLALYFCSGVSKDPNDLSHYALSVPLYTHFTSPLRRYPDIVVHRTLAAALEAEEAYLKCKRSPDNITNVETLNRCFTGLCFDKDEIESKEAQEALSAAASRNRVPAAETLVDMAAHCNLKRLLTRYAKDATDKLYVWALLKKREMLCLGARVLGLGPKFMSIYIPKLAIERRIYYDEVDGLMVHWLDETSTLVLSESSQKQSGWRSSPGRCKTIDEVALIVNPANPNLELKSSDLVGGEEDGEPERCGDTPDTIPCEPAFFPLTVNLQSTISVVLHAVGGDDGPRDIVARLYICSFFH